VQSDRILTIVKLQVQKLQIYCQYWKLRWPSKHSVVNADISQPNICLFPQHIVIMLLHNKSTFYRKLVELQAIMMVAFE